MYQYQEEVYLEGHPFYTGMYYIHSHNIQGSRYSLLDRRGKVLTYVSNGLEYVQEFDKEDIVSVKEKIIKKMNYGK